MRGGISGHNTKYSLLLKRTNWDPITSHQIKLNLTPICKENVPETTPSRQIGSKREIIKKEQQRRGIIGPHNCFWTLRSEIHDYLFFLARIHILPSQPLPKPAGISSREWITTIHEILPIILMVRDNNNNILSSNNSRITVTSLSNEQLQQQKESLHRIREGCNECRTSSMVLFGLCGVLCLVQMKVVTHRFSKGFCGVASLGKNH